jgi:hypothetical protein
MNKTYNINIEKVKKISRKGVSTLKKETKNKFWEKEL